MKRAGALVSSAAGARVPAGGAEAEVPVKGCAFWAVDYRETDLPMSMSRIPPHPTYDGQISGFSRGAYRQVSAARVSVVPGS